MSMMIESTDELLALLKKTNLKVASVDELQQLLASIHSHYNPEAARQKTGKAIGTVVPGLMAGAAAFASFCLLAAGERVHEVEHIVGGLAVIWGPTALVCTAAVIAGAVLSGVRRGRALPELPSHRPAFRSEPVESHIVKELQL